MCVVCLGDNHFFALFRWGSDYEHIFSITFVSYYIYECKWLVM